MRSGCLPPNSPTQKDGAGCLLGAESAPERQASLPASSGSLPPKSHFTLGCLLSQHMIPGICGRL